MEVETKQILPFNLFWIPGATVWLSVVLKAKKMLLTMLKRLIIAFVSWGPNPKTLIHRELPLTLKGIMSTEQLQK